MLLLFRNTWCDRDIHSHVMADPLGIIASVVAIATAAIRSSKALFELVDGIKRGPEEIKSISRDAHSFHSIVFSLNATLEDPSFTDVISGDDSMLEKVGNLARPLSDCEAVLSELMVKMQKQLKHGSDNSGDRMSFTNVKWCLFIKSEVRVLQLRLEAAKSTLNSALNGISMSGALPSFQSVELTDKPKTLWHAFVSHG